MLNKTIYIIFKHRYEKRKKSEKKIQFILKI